MIRSEKGMTLIEVLVAAVILVIVLNGVSTVIVTASKERKRFTEVSSLEKVVRSITTNVRQDYGSLPGFNLPANWGKAGYDPYSDNSIAYQVCYRKDGTATTLTASDCAFKCSYFVLRVVDSRFGKNSDMGTLPVNQMYLRVTYTSQKKQKKFFDSYLLTQTLRL